MKAAFSRIRSWARGPVMRGAAGGRALIYHQVTDALTDHTRHLQAHHGIQEFERQIAYLKKSFDVVAFSGFVQRQHDPRVVAITFDDGYRSVVENALAILERHQCPAKIYLNAAHVRGELGWLNKLSAIFCQSDDSALRAFGQIALPEHAQHRYFDIHTYWSDFVPGRTDAAVEAAYRRLNPVAGGVDLYLTEKDLATLARHPLLEWGSHSASHRPVDKLDPGDLWQEIVGGHRELERNLGDRLQGFALPFGVAAYRTTALAAVVAEIDDHFVTAAGIPCASGRVGTLPELARLPAPAKLDQLRLSLEPTAKPRASRGGFG